MDEVDKQVLRNVKHDMNLCLNLIKIIEENLESDRKINPVPAPVFIWVKPKDRNKIKNSRTEVQKYESKKQLKEQKLQENKEKERSKADQLKNTDKISEEARK